MSSVYIPNTGLVSNNISSSTLSAFKVKHKQFTNYDSYVAPDYSGRLDEYLGCDPICLSQLSTPVQLIEIQEGDGSLIRADQFNYADATAMATAGWRAFGTPPNPVIDPVCYEGKSMHLNSNHRWDVPIFSDVNMLYGGFNFQFSGSLNTLHNFMRFGAVPSLQLKINSSGNFILQNAVSTTIATGGTKVLANQCCQIQIQVSIEDAGVFKLWLNRELVIDYAGDTRWSTDTNTKWEYLGSGVLGLSWYISDHFHHDGSGLFPFDGTMPLDGEHKVIV